MTETDGIATKYIEKSTELHERHVAIADILKGKGHDWKKMMDALSIGAVAQLASLMAEDDDIDKDKALSLLIQEIFSELELRDINGTMISIAEYEYDHGSYLTPERLVENWLNEDDEM